jgi:hypothetical protein
VNVSFRAPDVPLFYMAMRERGPLPQERHVPLIRARMEILS